MSDYPEHLYKTEAGYREIMTWYENALAALPLDFESRYVETRYGRTHMLVSGPADAPPLVLVQGYGGSAPLWNYQLPDFSTQHRVYTLDLPGQPGRSAPVVPGLFGDNYALWLTEVLDALDLDRAHIGGVCLGGWIGLKFAAFAPDRVDKLVMLSPVGLARFKIYVRSGIPLVLSFGRDTTRAGERLLRMAFNPPGSGLPFNREVARAFLPVIKHYRVGVLAGIAAQRPSLKEFYKGARALFKFVGAEPGHELARIKAPTLLLVGEHESIYDPHRAVERARQHIPDLTAEIVPRTGHATIYDRPDYVNPRILRFLAEGSRIGD